MAEKSENESEPHPRYETPSVAEEILYESAKLMLLDSIEVGRDFCKFMIGFATGAIPVYLGLLNLFLPDQYSLSRWEQGFIAAPVGFFLVAAMVFVNGYRPTTDPLMPSDLVEIEKQRSSTIERRSERSRQGMWLFVAGIIASTAVLILVIPRI